MQHMAGWTDVLSHSSSAEMAFHGTTFKRLRKMRQLITNSHTSMNLNIIG
jgi:hypothetical protein